VVDGRWIPDPLAREAVPNPFGGRNSLLKVACSLETAHPTDAKPVLEIAGKSPSPPRRTSWGERSLHLAVQNLPMETAFEERDKVQLGHARHSLQIVTRAGGLRILRFVGPDQCGEGALA
jgi:hypothetical protein